jgi:hypothetical protein
MSRDEMDAVASSGQSGGSTAAGATGGGTPGGEAAEDLRPPPDRAGSEGPIPIPLGVPMDERTYSQLKRQANLPSDEAREEPPAPIQDSSS